MKHEDELLLSDGNTGGCAPRDVRSHEAQCDKHMSHVGILRYQMHKRMSVEGRAMALEAGTAMHECFAFVRLVSLIEQHKGNPDFQDVLWDVHGTRLFGDGRLQLIGEQVMESTDVMEIAKRGCIAVLDTGEFYDDPRDKRRTCQTSKYIYAYINRWRWDHRVWMRDPADPHPT